MRLFNIISGHSLGESDPTAEMQSVYSSQPQPTGQVCLFKYFHCQVDEGFRVSYKEDYPGSFDQISVAEFSLEKLSCPN